MIVKKRFPGDGADLEHVGRNIYLSSVATEFHGVDLGGHGEEYRGERRCEMKVRAKEA